MWRMFFNAKENCFFGWVGWVWFWGKLSFGRRRCLGIVSFLFATVGLNVAFVITIMISELLIGWLFASLGLGLLELPLCLHFPSLMTWRSVSLEVWGLFFLVTLSWSIATNLLILCVLGRREIVLQKVENDSSNLINRWYTKSTSFSQWNREINWVISSRMFGGLWILRFASWLSPVHLSMISSMIPAFDRCL